MWIFTSKGFISIVENRNDKATVVIRARNKAHLKALFPDAKIDKTPTADYMFRTVATKGQAAAVIAENVLNIGYDNFKNSVKERKYHDACSGTWCIMYAYQDALGEG